jgi:hypothetical protein
MLSWSTSERKICRVIYTPNPLLPAVILQWNLFNLHAFLEVVALKLPSSLFLLLNPRSKVYKVWGNVTDICALLARFNSCSSWM